MRVLMKGTEAMAEAAIRAGCNAYFGYPITPQTELIHYMSRRMPEVGGVFLQAESEVSVINMVYGAAAAGVRVMTSSSSPGISLMQEGISYLVGAELPAVLINVMRGGPGLGNIQPSQSDYFQSTKGGGHGDYKLITFAPSSVSEAASMVYGAFDIAEKYRHPVMILADGALGQIMEPVSLPEQGTSKPSVKDWALTGAKGRPANKILSFYLDPKTLEEHNLRLQEKFKNINEEINFEEDISDDMEILAVAYGTVARILKSAVYRLRNEGRKIGFFRPISLWPFPEDALKEASKKAKLVFVSEMSYGQMLEDVRRVVPDEIEVKFYGRAGGVVPSPNELYNKLKSLLERRA